MRVLVHGAADAMPAVLPDNATAQRPCVGFHRVANGAQAIASCSGCNGAVKRLFRLLHQQPQMSDRFIAHMLARNSRLEEDLVDQLFNASEKRLARALLLLARYGKPKGAVRVLPKISQEVLAEIVGTTRSRVNFFMNKFRKLGFIEYNGTLKVHDALLDVVLRSPDIR